MVILELYSTNACHSLLDDDDRGSPGLCWAVAFGEVSKSLSETPGPVPEAANFVHMLFVDEWQVRWPGHHSRDPLCKAPNLGGY